MRSCIVVCCLWCVVVTRVGNKKAVTSVGDKGGEGTRLAMCQVQVQEGPMG